MSLVKQNVMCTSFSKLTSKFSKVFRRKKSFRRCLAPRFKSMFEKNDFLMFLISFSCVDDKYDF